MYTFNFKTSSIYPVGYCLRHTALFFLICWSGPGRKYALLYFLVSLPVLNPAELEKEPYTHTPFVQAEVVPQV